MSSRRFILLATGLFMLGALPFLILQPTAAASAGLSLGFSAPLEHWFIIGLLFLTGLLCALLPREGLVPVPLAFTLMTMLGGMLMLDVGQFPPIRYFVLGAVHAVVFWVTVSAITPLVLVVCLFNARRRCLHDFLVGTVVINNAERTAAMRVLRWPR